MEKQTNKFLSNTFLYLGMVFIFLIILICFLPMLLTSKTSVEALNFTQTGQIGDTVGGIMSPFIAIVASGLTFAAFWAQFKANELQATQFRDQAVEAEKNYLEKYYDSLNQDISDARYGDLKGVDAYLAVDLRGSVKNSVLDNLNLVLYSYETYLSAIELNKVVSDSFKHFMITRLNLLFYSKVLWPLHEEITKRGNDLIERMHDDSQITLKKFAILGIQCIEYLIKHKLAADSSFKQENIRKLKLLLDVVPKSI